MDFIFVTGMHRSGTSCITAELTRHGLPISSNLLQADDGNVKGYFEDPYLISLHDQMLGALGSNWMDPAELPADWVALLNEKGFDKQLESYVAEISSDSSTFLIKEPRISRLLPIWLQVLGKRGDTCSILRIVRAPLDVTNSLLRRNNIPSIHSLQLWARYNLDLLKHADGVPMATLNFETFLSNPESLATAIDQIGLRLVAAVNIGEFSDPNLRQTGNQSDTFEKFPIGFDPVELSNFEFGRTDYFEKIYGLCGGNIMAVERRHYSFIHSTLWTVVDELKESRAKLGFIHDKLDVFRSLLEIKRD